MSVEERGEMFLAEVQDAIGPMIDTLCRRCYLLFKSQERRRLAVLKTDGKK